MLHQINLLFRRFLTDARQLFRFFVIVNLIPCICWYLQNLILLWER